MVVEIKSYEIIFSANKFCLSLIQVIKDLKLFIISLEAEELHSTAPKLIIAFKYNLLLRSLF